MAGVVWWLPPRLLVATSRAAVARNMQRASIVSLERRCNAVPVSVSPLAGFHRFSTKPPNDETAHNPDKDAAPLGPDEQQVRARQLQAKRPWHREDADRPPADKSEATSHAKGVPPPPP